MTKIIPIEDLSDTSMISSMVHESNEPVFVIKSGSVDMVVMSMEVYEQSMSLYDLSSQLGKAERDFKEGKVLDAHESLDAIEEKYGLSHL